MKKPRRALLLVLFTSLPVVAALCLALIVYDRLFVADRYRTDAHVEPRYAIVVDAQRVLDARLADHPSIAFLSWNGTWIGTDCDSRIILRRGGAAKIIQYGVGVQGYSGTFVIHGSSVIVDAGTKLPCPPMALATDGKVLALVRTDCATDLEFGIDGKFGTFWPFREVKYNVGDDHEE